MMTTLEILRVLGENTWQPFWVPVFVWTVFAVPVWIGLESVEKIHPRAEYRLGQILLATLPLGLVAVAGAGHLLTPSALAVIAPRTATLSPVEVTPTNGPGSYAWTWVHGVGLLTVVGAIVATARLSQLAVHAVAVRRIGTSFDSAPSDDLQAQVDALAKNLGLRRPVRALFSTQAVVPLTLGGRRPLVLLPSSLKGAPEKQKLTLLHECVHIRRYDDVAHAIERLIEAVFFFHPLVGRLQKLIDHSRERACDTAVLEQSRSDVSTYARLLLGFADATPKSTPAVSLSESPSALKRRLTAMKSPLPPMIRSRAELATTGLLLGLALTIGMVGCSDSLSPSTADESPTQERPSSSVAAAKDLEQPPEVKGGLKALVNHIDYPSLAREADIQGRVFVQFVVTTTGDARAIRVVRGVHPALDSAAVEAVRSVRFTPGRKQGKSVATRMTLPVSFQLPDDTSTGDSQPTGTAASDVGTSEQGTRRIEGGLAALQKAVSYPDVARKAGIEGTVVVAVTIDRAGRVTDAMIEESVHKALDAAALRAVKTISFTARAAPDETRTKEVNVPVTFSLPDEADA